MEKLFKRARELSPIDHFLWVQLFAISSFLFLKFRHLKRLGFEEKILGFLFQDFLFFTVCTFTFLFFCKKLKPLLLVVFTLICFHILFISKMGYPMTRSLFSQTGDFLMVQTSIAAPSVYKAIIALLIIVLGFVYVLFGFLPSIKPFLRKVGILSFCLLIFGSALGYVLQVKSGDQHLGYNILYSMVRAPNTLQSALKKIEERVGVSASEPWVFEGSVSKSQNKKKKSIVFIVVETLSQQDLAKNFSEMMPFTYSLKESGQSFESHYSAWPFSSKSLYSIVCGKYPLASNLIEMRVLGEGNCRGWVKQLISSYGYDSYLGYTGDLNYDNMRKFFKSQGFETLKDRHAYSATGEYKTSLLSVDDMSMADDFQGWVEQKKTPFVSFFITMNSHFPFWSPGGEKVYEDSYKNALRYQDGFIKKIVDILKAKGLWGETILVITGDHGRQVVAESRSLFPERAFKVPLIISGGGVKKALVKYPTVHNFIGASLFQKATENYYGYKNHNLNSEIPIFVFSETDQLKIAQLSSDSFRFMSLDLENIYETSRWSDSNDSCSKGCEKILTPFYNFLKNDLEAYNFSD